MTADRKRARGGKAKDAEDAGAEDPAKPPASRKAVVENKIFAEAAVLFAERGFAGTNFQDIADAMGMTRAALYYYVKNKEELLARLVTETTEAPAAEIRHLARHPDADAAARLRGVARVMALRRASDPNQYRLMVRSEAELPADLADSQRAAHRATVRELVALIEEGIGEGLFRPVDPRTTALAMIGMCNWIAWWQQPIELTPAEVADQIADLVLAMVRRPDGRLAGAVGVRAVIAQFRADLDYLERALDQREQA